MIINDPVFHKAIAFLLGHEGGYVNNPRDPGGETNFGISKRSYPTLDIRHLTRDQAIQIYYRDWWTQYGYGRLTGLPDIAIKAFDLAVVMGPIRAHMLLQEAVNATSDDVLNVDGRIGPLTADAVNFHPSPGWLMDRLRLNAVTYFRKLNKSTFLAGWITRALD